METSRFDALTASLRDVGSRRRLLGVLAALPVGGLLAALGEDETSARNKGQGRKRSHRAGKQKRKRQRRRRKHRKNFFLRGHSVYLKNPANARATVTIEGIETEYLGRCKLLGKIDLAPGKDALFDTGNHTLTLTINRHYDFGYINAVFKTPRMTAGIWGSSDLCPTRTTTSFDESFSEGEATTVTLEGKQFAVRRNDDKSDFKYWSLEFPSNL